MDHNEVPSNEIFAAKTRRKCSHQGIKSGVQVCYDETALWTRRPTSRIQSSSSAPSHNALSASAKARAHSDFWRAVTVG